MPVADLKMFYTVSATVIAVHICLIGFFSIQKETYKTIHSRQRLVVQTISFARVSEAPPLTEVSIKPIIAQPKHDIIKASSQSKSVSKELEQVKKIVPAAKKTPVASKKPVSKPPVLTPKKAASKPDPVRESTSGASVAKKQQLLAQLQKNMAKITNEQAPSVSQGITWATPPQALSDLNIDASSNTEFNYESELARRLKLLLHLPQYGEVEVQLTLYRSGKVANLVVLSTANVTNKAHVEKIVPTLSLPPFGSTFAGEEQHTFRIILSNTL